MIKFDGSIATGTQIRAIKGAWCYRLADLAAPDRHDVKDARAEASSRVATKPGAVI